MKFRRTPQFREDFNNLEEADRIAVSEAFKSVALALQGKNESYFAYRIQRMHGKPGIWEGHIKQNLCFTFHYENTNDGEKICLFRRIGTHSVYEKP
jgi:mRNA-degrading endonuclease YafQ of YafQ-DinJ toxin-antitoxin module